MKAAVLKGKQNMVYDDVPDAKCEKGGLLLEMEAVGLCGSDMRTIRTGHATLDFPFILGHENIGKIIEVGEGVKGYKTGERVIVNPVIPCGTCHYCERGLQNLCDHRLTYGHEIYGGFAKYLSIPKIGVDHGQILKLREDNKSEEMVVVELLSSVVNAQEYANVSLGDNVVIIGAGPIGCLHTEVARLNGAKNIIMANRSEERLERSKQFSGTHFVNTSKEDLKQVVMDITDGLGADVLIVCAPAGEPIENGIDCLRKRGRLVIFGGLPKDNPYAKLNSNTIHYREIAVLGSFSTTNATFERAFDIASHNMVNMNIVTDVLPLEEINVGIEKLANAQALKVVLKP